MGSALVFPPGSDQELAPPGEPAPVSVTVQSSRAEAVTRVFQAEGQALPDRDTEIRTETSGVVAEVFVRRGEDVQAGARIARIDATRADANLARARAEFDEAQRDLATTEQLFEQGIETVDGLAQARLAVASAEAQLTVAQETLADTFVEAAFAGRIESLDLDPGEFVQAGSTVGRIVDNQPLLVAIQVPQQALTRIRNGQNATVQFITGEVREGTVTFVGTAASAETRTFPAEITVDNPDGLIPAGISAEVRIPTSEVVAHFVSPSTVSLNPAGELGVKTVKPSRDAQRDEQARSPGDQSEADDDAAGKGAGADHIGIVEFHPVDIVRAEVGGVWVSGLPDTASIITIGQGYVRDGDRVRARTAEPAS
jgi:multidrug efflux system membrane fusion protein